MTRSDPRRAAGRQATSAGDLLDRLLARAERDHETGCLLWRGALTEGYGKVSHQGRALWAHRLVLALLIDPDGWNDPDPTDVLGGLHVRHLCHERACIEPAHLAYGSRLDNARDSIEAGWPNGRPGPKG